jgi:hypothetical protein
VRGLIPESCAASFDRAHFVYCVPVSILAVASALIATEDFLIRCLGVLVSADWALDLRSDWGSLGYIVEPLQFLPGVRRSFDERAHLIFIVIVTSTGEGLGFGTFVVFVVHYRASLVSDFGGGCVNDIPAFSFHGYNYLSDIILRIIIKDVVFRNLPLILKMFFGFGLVLYKKGLNNFIIVVGTA